MWKRGDITNYKFFNAKLDPLYPVITNFNITDKIDGDDPDVYGINFNVENATSTNYNYLYLQIKKDGSWINSSGGGSNLKVLNTTINAGESKTNNSVTDAFNLQGGGTYSFYFWFDNNSFSNYSDTNNNFVVTKVIDTTAPTLTEVTPISNTNNNSSPEYTFNSTEAGTITLNVTDTHGENITINNYNVIQGSNTIKFNHLPAKTYGVNLTVTDDYDNTSSALTIPIYINKIKLDSVEYNKDTYLLTLTFDGTLEEIQSPSGQLNNLFSFSRMQNNVMPLSSDVIDESYSIRIIGTNNKKLQIKLNQTAIKDNNNINGNISLFINWNINNINKYYRNIDGIDISNYYNNFYFQTPTPWNWPKPSLNDISFIESGSNRKLRLIFDTDLDNIGKIPSTTESFDNTTGEVGIDFDDIDFSIKEFYVINTTVVADVDNSLRVKVFDYTNINVGDKIYPISDPEVTVVSKK